MSIITVTVNDSYFDIQRAMETLPAPSVPMVPPKTITVDANSSPDELRAYADSLEAYKNNAEVVKQEWMKYDATIAELESLYWKKNRLEFPQLNDDTYAMILAKAKDSYRKRHDVRVHIDELAEFVEEILKLNK